MSETSMKQIASNVEVKVPKTDVGDKIIKLKKQKAAAKTAFTKCKNKLYNLIEQVDVPSRREVRDEIDKNSDNEQAINKNVVTGKHEKNVECLDDKLNVVESSGAHYDVRRRTNPVTTQNELGVDMWKQLKRVSIPTFNGDIKMYENWKAAFVACVDMAPAIPEYKLLQLRQCLTGEALKVIASLGHSAAAYDIALERLERKYGGKRRNIALKLEEITKFKPIRAGNARDLEKFADLLDILVANLRESDKLEELGDGTLYSQLLKKLTESMVIQYQRWIFETQRQESVEVLREWILQESEFQVIASEVINGFAEKQRSHERKTSGKSGTFFGNKENKKSNGSMSNVSRGKS
ncbi:uncharacterized protein LOC124291243 [Haliotis rubra]|uniref:uncharacterized protein LOC124291243 n=1 Tax=Haliotis rubra TaxID=36100 RepID=UPI001EE5B0C4|nr:uncharacterized protein LOC124291243 [Haliotis rubra]